MEWQPIETVPDNKDVLFFESFYGLVFVGQKFMGAIVVDRFYLKIDGCECASMRDDIEQKAVTHWMLLPNPPSDV